MLPENGGTELAWKYFLFTFLGTLAFQYGAVTLASLSGFTHPEVRSELLTPWNLYFQTGWFWTILIWPVILIISLTVILPKLEMRSFVSSGKNVVRSQLGVAKRFWWTKYRLAFTYLLLCLIASVWFHATFIMGIYLNSRETIIFVSNFEALGGATDDPYGLHVPTYLLYVGVYSVLTVPVLTVLMLPFGVCGFAVIDHRNALTGETSESSVDGATAHTT